MFTSTWKETLLSGIEHQDALWQIWWSSLSQATSSMRAISYQLVWQRSNIPHVKHVASSLSSVILSVKHYNSSQIQLTKSSWSRHKYNASQTHRTYAVKTALNFHPKQFHHFITLFSISALIIRFITKTNGRSFWSINIMNGWAHLSTKQMGAYICQENRRN